MPSVAATSFSSPAALNGSQVDSSVRVPKKVLGQEDFLKLLAVQFQTQDPMKPIEDTAFIAQMAQFSSLEQMSQLRRDQQMMTSAGYLGRTVTVQDFNGELFTGQVTAIDNTSGVPSLVINGTNYPMTSVKRIETGVATTPTDGTGTPNGTPVYQAPVNPYDPLPNILSLIRDRVTQGN
jgi:flagellar basal-body rod modification protein FlgD